MSVSTSLRNSALTAAVGSVAMADGGVVGNVAAGAAAPLGIALVAGGNVGVAAATAASSAAVAKAGAASANGGWLNTGGATFAGGAGKSPPLGVATLGHRAGL